jgi:hypothetical protein
MNSIQKIIDKKSNGANWPQSIKITKPGGCRELMRHIRDYPSNINPRNDRGDAIYSLLFFHEYNLIFAKNK